MGRDRGIGMLSGLLSALTFVAIFVIARPVHAAEGVEDAAAFEGRWIVAAERPLDEARMDAIDRATRELGWPLGPLVRRVLAKETRPPASFTLRSARAGLELVLDGHESATRTDARDARAIPNRIFGPTRAGRVEAAWTLAEAQGVTAFELDADGSLWIIESIRITSPDVPPITYRYHGHRQGGGSVRRSAERDGA